MYVFLLLLAVQISTLEQGLALLEQGRATDAIPLLVRATQAQPADPVAWKALGVAHASLSHYEQAEPAFAQACRLAPRLADTCYFEGRALYALNRFEASIAALERSPSNAKVRLGIGQALEALGRFDEAERAMRGAAGIDNGPAANVALGLLLLRTGRASEAEVLLARTVDKFPNSADARLQLARALMERAAFDLAITQLEFALQLSPTAQAHLLLAKAYTRIGRAKDAQPHFEAAAKATQ